MPSQPAPGRADRILQLAAGESRPVGMIGPKALMLGRNLDIFDLWSAILEGSLNYRLDFDCPIGKLSA